MSESPQDPRRRQLLRILFGGLGLGAVTGGAWSLRERVEPSTAAQSTVTPSPPSATPTTGHPSTTSTTSTTSAPTTTTVSPPAPRLVEVVARSEWGAETQGAFRTQHPVRLTYHHAASATSDPGTAMERVREYQRFHQSQGWPDIAYHFVVDQAGRIYEGRPPQAVGDTFTSYDPTGHFLVCLDGNFDVDEPTEESLAMLAVILAWACSAFDISPGTLTGHRDHAPETTCPGTHAYRRRDEIVRTIERIIAEGPIELVTAGP